MHNLSPKSNKMAKRLTVWLLLAAMFIQAFTGVFATTDLFDGVFGAISGSNSGKVNGIVAPTSMPANIPTADEIKWVKMFDEGRQSEIPLSGMEIKTLTSPGSRVRTLMNGPDKFDILVSNLSIGDAIAFSGMPCEPFVDLGRDVKSQSPFRMTIATSLTNGSEGYIPSTKAHHEGGYEGLSSRYAAPTGDRLVAAQLNQLKSLKEQAAK